MADEKPSAELPLPTGEGGVRVATPRLHEALPPRLKRNARSLRVSITDAEARLWYHLRNRQMAGRKFRRQHPFGPYVLDFYCECAGLVVEIDGSQHLEERNAAYDAARSRYLESRSLQVLRFNNLEALTETESVLSVILEALEHPHPGPLPRGEGTQPLSPRLADD